MVDRYKVKAMIHRHLTDEYGPDALTNRPSKGLDADGSLEWQGPTDFLQGMRTALMTARMAEGIARDWARDARGGGASWVDVAEVLGQLLPAESEDPAIEAFVWVAPTPSMRFDRVTVSWRCSACGRMVTDHGPYESHPVDNESGHADDCTRQAAEIAAWKIRAGWDDDE